MYDNVAIQDNAAFESGFSIGYTVYLLLVLPEDNQSTSILDWVNGVDDTTTSDVWNLFKNVLSKFYCS